jgi:hypothetical protein
MTFIAGHFAQSVKRRRFLASGGCSNPPRRILLFVRHVRAPAPVPAHGGVMFVCTLHYDTMKPSQCSGFTEHALQHDIMCMQELLCGPGATPGQEPWPSAHWFDLAQRGLCFLQPPTNATHITQTGWRHRPSRDFNVPFRARQ